MQLLPVLTLLSALVGLVSAQLPPGTPSCAIPCLMKSLSATTCGLKNTTCLCSDTAYTAAVEVCALDRCLVEDLLVLRNTTNTTCGVPTRNVVAQFTIISNVLATLAGVFVVVRIIYKHFFTPLGLGPDDWTIVAVCIACIPSAVLNSKIAKHGLGRDVWTLTPADITEFGIALWGITVIYYVAITLLKISILLFYLRIFPSQGFRRIVWVTIAFIAVYGLAFIFAHTLQCTPVSYNWTQWNDPGGRPGMPPKHGYCVNNIQVARANGIISIILDVWMLVLPLQKVRSLNVSQPKKLAIGSMFAVGTFVTVVSIIRLIYLVQFENSNNLTYDWTSAIVWSTVEIATGIICACMPSVRLILIRLWPRIFGSVNGSRVAHDHSTRNGERSHSKPATASSAAPADFIAPLKTTLSLSSNNGFQSMDNGGRGASVAWKRLSESTSSPFRRTGNEALVHVDCLDEGFEDSMELQASSKSSIMSSNGVGLRSALSVASSAEDIESRVRHEGPLERRPR